MQGSVPLTAILGLLVILTACAPKTFDPVNLGSIEVETRPTAIASILRADLNQKGGGLLVSGTLRRTHEVKIPGHIDILICGPQGLIEKQAVAVPGLSSKRKGALNLPFKTHFNFVPPAGSKVILRYHAAGSAPLDESTCAVVSQPGPVSPGRPLLARPAFRRLRIA